MGYRISYEGGVAIETTPRRPTGRKRPRVVGIIMVVLFVTICWTVGRDAVSDLLLPGDEAVTEQAIQGLVEDLKGGASVGDAVEAFCEAVIYYDR